MSEPAESAVSILTVKYMTYVIRQHKGKEQLAIVLYFGEGIKTVLLINLLFLLLLVQSVYVIIRWYMKGWREARGFTRHF